MTAAVAVAASAIGAVLLAPAVGAGPTVALVLDCTVPFEPGPVPYTLPFATRASAWVPEGGTAELSIDPVTQNLPAQAPPPLAPYTIADYTDVTLQLAVTGATVTGATVATPGSNIGPAPATVTTTATTVTLLLPGPVPAGQDFVTPAVTVTLAATSPGGGEVVIAPGNPFYGARASNADDMTLPRAPVSCGPTDALGATTTIPVIAPSAPEPPPLPPAPPPAPPGPAVPPGPPIVGAGQIVPLAPRRLLDTRDGTGAPVGAIPAGGSVSVAARGVAGIPLDASAVVLNVTATEPDGDGFVTVYPCGSTVPVVSNVNYGAGDTVPNLATVPLAADGRVCLFTYERAHLVADVSGALVPSGDTYTGTSPVRLVDTRDGTGVAAAGVLAPGTQLVVPVAGRVGAPGTATAAVANVTVSQAAGAGYLSAFPCGQTPPNASNLNFVAGQTVSNLALTRLGTGGALCIVVSTATQVVVDLSGWTTPTGGATLGIVDPVRVLDTRTIGARLAAGQTLALPVALAGAPSGAQAVVANVTAVDPAGPGYLSVYPCGQAPPNSSNVNYAAGETRPVLVMAAIGATGEVCITSYAAADVLVDLQGWFV